MIDIYILYTYIYVCVCVCVCMSSHCCSCRFNTSEYGCEYGTGDPIRTGTGRFPCSFLLRPTGINDSLGSWILYQNTSQPASNPIIDRSEREESDLP